MNGLPETEQHLVAVNPLPKLPDTSPGLPASSIVPIPDAADPLASASAADRMQQALELLGVLPASSVERREIGAEAATYRLLGISPRDPIEGMMATQMLALHAATIDCARRAALPEQDSDVRRGELNLAQKTSRAFTQLVDTLDRRRRGGEQKMIVEHVHVHAGGQAIVGNVKGSAQGTRSN